MRYTVIVIESDSLANYNAIGLMAMSELMVEKREDGKWRMKRNKRHLASEPQNRGLEVDFIGLIDLIAQASNTAIEDPNA